MGLFKTIAEGGQIWAHRVRMVRQVARIAFLLSFGLGALFFIYRMSLTPTFYYKSLYYYIKANSLDRDQKVSVETKFWWQVERQRFYGKTIPINSENLERICKRKVKVLLAKTHENLSTSLHLSCLIFGGSVLFFLVKGLISRKKKHVEGQKIAAPWQIAFWLKLSGRGSDIKVGSLPLVRGSETRHILISGGTGSGKTNCFHHLLPQIREKKQRAVIVDTNGEYVSRYFREGKDILFNPFDSRGVNWHPWCECKDSFDYKSIAQSFISSSFNEEENFWRKAAQEVFSSILQLKKEEKKISQIVDLLLFKPLPLLYESLKDTKAAPFLDMSSEKTAGSIRAVAASYLECLELFEDTDNPFSLRNWVQNTNDDSWVFLSTTMGQRASLIPMVSAWFSIAMRSLLQMNPHPEGRLWFIADELPSLNRLKDLEVCLTESRKFGGCALLALQSPAQLEMIYGRDLTRIILGNCATRIAFSEQDPEIAVRISKIFGDKETKESQEALSYGAHEMRDGVNLSYQSKVSPVVSPTALQSLNPHEAFIKLPGRMPISKIKLKYQQISMTIEPFIPKKEMTYA